MRILLTITLFIAFKISVAQNPYIGKWVVYDINSFKGKDTNSNDQKDNFKSVIHFKEDLTFIKITNGVTTYGRYEYTSNRFKFLEKNKLGEYDISWRARSY